MKAVFLLAVIVLLTASRSARAQSSVASGTNSVAACPLLETNRAALPARWHSVPITPKPKKISTWSKFNPCWWFGNMDEPTPPGWYRPEEKGRVFKWHLRNPFHNFAFYVIGIADKPHVRSGRYPLNIGNPHGGWNFAVAKYKLLRLPFLAYNRGGFDFYFGWRTAGNFGGKLNLNARRPPSSKRSEPHLTAPSESSDLPVSEP